MGGTVEPVDLAVCIAPYQLPDRVQLGRIRSALARARQGLVFVARAFQAPSARHPFAWGQRVAMLAASLDDDERARVAFQPLREHYDGVRTLRALQAGVRRHLGTRPARVLWLLPSTLRHAQEDCPAEGPLELHDDDADGGSERRLDALYAAQDPRAALEALAEDLAPGTLPAVREWLAQPAFRQLQAEWRLIAGEKKAWSVAPYPVVLVTVDAVVRAGAAVLLVRRGRPPGQGLWALPGGFLDPEETVLQAALRELVEETGLPLTAAQMRRCLRGVKVFDHPGRSQRGRIVTHAHFFDLGDAAELPVQGGDDAAAAQWVPLAALASMETQFHDDHFHVLDEFLGLTGDP